MSDPSIKSTKWVLDPIDRVSEILTGLIMVLTFTSSLSVATAEHVRLRKDDWRGAIAVLMLMFLSTFPVVIPFMLMQNDVPALRVSNVVAIMLLFLTGYTYARLTGGRPWVVGVALVVLGAVLVGITMALGG